MRLIILLVFLSSCAGTIVSNEERAWINIGGIGTGTLFWCDAKKDPPICKTPIKEDDSLSY
jgi:hypothetical protein